MAGHPGYSLLASQLSDRGIDIEEVKRRLRGLRIETPSWGYGDSGTRFKTFPRPGAARDVREKLADAAMVHRLIGACPSVALHIPWDRVEDWAELRAYAESLGLSIGAINPNLFQDDGYRLGSVCNPEARVRERAVAHILECVEIAKATGSTVISLWLADGTNYGGQDSFAERRRRLFDCLQQVYAALPRGMRLLIEYKFFEPAFCHTDVPDWGTAYALALKLGPQAQVLVDTGHHAQGTNVEQIVSFLLGEGKLGGFHFNDRRYADDDLMAGSVNPFALFLIFHELYTGDEAHVALMIDQSHNIEPKIEAMVQSVVNLQAACARALIVDRGTLSERRAAGDVLGAHRVLSDAFETDVRPLLAQVRVEMGLHPDPIVALKESGYEERVARERGVSAEAGGGYPGE
ncbi:MAG TPA: L-rhamnose isomerase [Dehalococcoidia bacterium]|nr:L-rhamnose isomerase [Dehalococcoidia bacterium]